MPILEINPHLSPSRINILSPCVTKIKGKGESGFPYCNPLEGLNKLEANPLISNAQETKEIHPMIQVITSRLKPIPINKTISLCHMLYKDQDTIEGIFLVLIV